MHSPDIALDLHKFSIPFYSIGFTSLNQDHLLQRTATRNLLLWWPKETFQGLSEGQFEEVRYWAEWTGRPGGRQIWVALTLQGLSATVWSQSRSVFASKESSPEVQSRRLTAQTLSATSAGGYVRQGSDCTHTATRVICDQRSGERLTAQYTLFNILPSSATSMYDNINILQKNTSNHSSSQQEAIPSLLDACGTSSRPPLSWATLLFIYLLTEHLHFQRNITAGQQGTNKH